MPELVRPLWEFFYSPPPIPSVGGGAAARWLGLEQDVINACLFFYEDGFKDGCVFALSVVIALYLAYRLLKRFHDARR